MVCEPYNATHKLNQNQRSFPAFTEIQLELSFSPFKTKIGATDAGSISHSISQGSVHPNTDEAYTPESVLMLHDLWQVRSLLESLSQENRPHDLRQLYRYQT